MGNTSGKTLIELTSKTSARRHASSVQKDISRFLTINSGRKRQKRTSLVNGNRSPSSASSTQADFQQTYLKQIVIQLAVNSGKSLLSQFRLTQQIIDQRKQARAEHAEIWQNRCHQTKHYSHSDKFQANFKKRL